MKVKVLVVAAVILISADCRAQAQNQTTSSWLKSMGTAVVQAGTQALCPQAQAVVDQANKLGTAQEKENFLVAKAKEFLGTKNYEAALELGNYIKANINSKSGSADKIIADAKAALAKYAQDKLNQATVRSSAQSNQTAEQVNQTQSDLQKTSADVKNLLGSFSSKK